MPRLVIDIPNGTKFGMLTLLSTYQTEPNTPYRCRVRCDCGTEKVVNKSNLLRGSCNSCGCLKNELSRQRMTIHGHSNPDGARSPTYISWHSMVGRLRHPKGYDVQNYAHVDMDPRWADFANFLADMGERPAGKTIDRIDGTKGYWPDNCRWATPWEQAQNKRVWKHTPEGLKAISIATKARHAANRQKE
jgi:hypothetical protein